MSNNDNFKDSVKKAREFDKKHHILTLVLMILAAGGFIWGIFMRESYIKEAEAHHNEVRKLEESNQLLFKVAEIDELVIFKGKYNDALDEFLALHDTIEDPRIRKIIDKRIERLNHRNDTDNYPDVHNQN